MNKLTTFFFVFLTTFYSLQQNAFASCDVGPVLFRDTLYGAGVGTGVGALVLLANSSTSNIAPNLATSALVGAGAGLVVGVVEVSLSDCFNSKKSRDENYGSRFQVKPLVSLAKETKSKPTLQNEQSHFSLNQLSGGIQLEYKLN